MKFTITVILSALFILPVAIPTKSNDAEAPQHTLNETRHDNIDERGPYVGGDMILTPEQVENLKQGIVGSSYRWFEGKVPYYIDRSFSGSERAVILKGMSHISSKTCITFSPRTSESAFVYIRRGGDGSGCYSNVGRQPAQPQIVNIQGSYSSGSCLYSGIIAHELIHALGFYHEQSRADRDDFVSINWANIQRSQSYNFDKVGYVHLFGVSYDYDSLMHYSAYAFAINPSVPTMTPRQNGVSMSRLGQRETVSAGDAQKINAMYSCTVAFPDSLAQGN